jgi:Mn2+/Fe2+ NRAMP family transporter
MPADSDVGSIITAAQSGALWRYTLILPQVLLVPFLYFIQEITVRLGIVTHKGHAELVRINFGKGGAYLSSSTLFLAGLVLPRISFIGLTLDIELLNALVLPLVLGFLLLIGRAALPAAPPQNGDSGSS